MQRKVGTVLERCVRGRKKCFSQINNFLIFVEETKAKDAILRFYSASKVPVQLEFFSPRLRITYPLRAKRFCPSIGTKKKNRK